MNKEIKGPICFLVITISTFIVTFFTVFMTGTIALKGFQQEFYLPFLIFHSLFMSLITCYFMIYLYYFFHR